MDTTTYPSLVFDTTILENGIIRIPELYGKVNQNIHIVIVFKQNSIISEKKTKSLAGSLKKYANPDLIEKETELAWSNVTDNQQ